MQQAALEALRTHLRATAALESVEMRLGWDQETMMPAKGGAQRADERAALAGVIHARWSDPRLAGMIADVEAGAGADEDLSVAADIDGARRAHDRATRVPAALAEALARATTHAHRAWVSARACGRFAAFAPSLEEILRLKREEADAISTSDGSRYDALLDEYERGAREADLAALFGRLAPGLADLAQRIAASPVEPEAISGRFDGDTQILLARKLATALGFDWDAGRLDLSAHPFSSGSGEDVRITTRVDEADPMGCLFSTIHEVGHALYEQGLAPHLRGLPSGRAASYGVHESQSRFFENHVGRSRAFAEWLFHQTERAFGEIRPNSPDAFHRSINRVEPGFIRTEADEVHYGLHIILRFELERALFAGDLEVADLEAAWDDRFEALFGRRPPNASLGVLQDVHWSQGAFGYFPAYTLGDIYAAALAQAHRAGAPDFDERLMRGDASTALAWMGAKIHARGALRTPRDLISDAIGGPVDEAPFLAYLEAKFGEIYAL